MRVTMARNVKVAVVILFVGMVGAALGLGFFGQVNGDNLRSLGAQNAELRRTIRNYERLDLEHQRLEAQLGSQAQTIRDLETLVTELSEWR